MKTEAFLAAAAVVFGLLSHSALSHAVDGGPLPLSDHECRRIDVDQAPGRWHRLAERLHLTTLHLSPAQHQSMNAIEGKYRPQLRSLCQALSDNRATLAKMDADDPKLQDAAAAQGKAIAGLIVARKQMRAEMRQVLTEAQRQALDQKLEERRTHKMRRD